MKGLIRILISIVGLICVGVTQLSAQSINTEFGKNRVQYHDDFDQWWMYETENFITYWYGKSKQVAIPAMQLAEHDHDYIQKTLEHRINDKIEILVYTDISDLKQSNIGTEETYSSKTGETKIAGNKMFVYFDGDHQHLRKQIRQGIADVYFSNMLFGNNLQEILQNAVLLNLPEWYKSGLVAYTATQWDSEIDNSLRELWSRDKRYHNFDKLAENHPRIAGHSMWYFIDQNYGKSSISNIIYLTKISRGIHNSFEYILNVDMKTLKKEWTKYYDEVLQQNNTSLQVITKKDQIKLKNKKEVNISALKTSPDGTQLLYCTNDLGRYKVYLHDLQSGISKKVFTYGYKNYFQETDYNYPVLTWHPDGREFMLIYEHRDVIKLMRYNMSSAEKITQIIPTDFQRIYSAAYIDENNYVFSGTYDGYSNLFYYRYKNRNHGPLINDFYDDVEISYGSYKNQKGYLFASNRGDQLRVDTRHDSIAPVDLYDIYFMPENTEQVIRLTQSSHISERNPQFLSADEILFTSDHTGINNAFVLDLNTGTTTALSNSERPYTIVDATTGNKTWYGIRYENKFYRCSRHKLDDLPQDQPKPSYFFDHNIGETESSILLLDPKANQEIKINNDILFQSPWSDPDDISPILSPVENQKNDSAKKRNSIGLLPLHSIVKPLQIYDNTRMISANKRFGLSNLVTKLDNDLLFEGLESYTGDRQQLLTTPMGILLKAEIKDLFEDYVITSGIRIPTSFNGSETFIVFDNRKARIDRKMALYRKSSKYVTSDINSTNVMSSKKTSTLGLYQWKFPLDIYQSFRATSTLRFDRFLQLSTDNNSFAAGPITEKRLSLKLEYIYDNTHDAGLNIKHGTRAKIYNESINEFDINFIDGFKFSLSDGFTNVIGFDARHYIPVLKRAVLALRGSGATSIGNKKMLYYLGGVENSLRQKFDNVTPIYDADQYAYKVNAFHLRGFDNNARNGATYFLTNAELRIPLFQYFMKNNRGSQFLRNMQIVGFFDTGLAFYGSSPFSAKNPLNKITITSPPLIELEVDYFRDPLVVGYGVGLRTQIFGYLVKLDYGYGVDTRQVLDPKLHISIGTDF
jgi:Tol biopolymer transport system component